MRWFEKTSLFTIGFTFCLALAMTIEPVSAQSKSKPTTWSKVSPPSKKKKSSPSLANSILNLTAYQDDDGAGPPAIIPEARPTVPPEAYIEEPNQIFDSEVFGSCSEGGDECFECIGDCDSCSSGGCDSCSSAWWNPFGWCSGGTFMSGYADKHYYGGPNVGEGNEWVGTDYWGSHCEGCGRGRICDRICQECSKWNCIQDWNITMGIESAKGPFDHGMNGNFGFRLGTNYSFPFWHSMGIGIQAGGAVTLTNLSGERLSGEIGKNRRQGWMTFGVFHRPFDPAWGLNFGAVVDMLSDDYYQELGMSQVRAEISYQYDEWSEIGVWMAAKTNEEFAMGPVTDPNTLYVYRAQNQYNLFYRYHLKNGAKVRVWGGGTNDRDLIFGSQIKIPFSTCWALNIANNYKIPNEGRNINGATHESWGMMFNVAYFPGKQAMKVPHGRYRPMFDVANNSTFMTDQVIQTNP